MLGHSQIHSRSSYSFPRWLRQIYRATTLREIITKKSLDSARPKIHTKLDEITYLTVPK